LSSLKEDLKREMPLDKDAEFEKARDVLLGGNFSGFEAIRNQWTNRTMRTDAMSKDEAQFWRLQRYAHPWPPPWLPHMHNHSNPVVFLDVAVHALDRCV